MKETIITKGLKVKTYIGEEIDLFSQSFLIKIAKCYRDIYNESWKESWNIKSALNEIKIAFKHFESRLPVVSIVFDKEKVVGFAWGKICRKTNIILEYDMPFPLLYNEKKEGYDRIIYWLEKVNKTDLIFNYKEFGILKQYRDRLAAYLTYDVLKVVLDYECNKIFLWTNINSNAFNYSLGLSWYPIHYFIKNDLVLFAGDIRYSIKIVENICEKNANSESYNELFQNLGKYLGY